MLDRVLDRLVGRHRHVLQLFGLAARRGQPAPQRAAEGAQRRLVAEHLELHPHRRVGQRPQDQEGDVVVGVVGRQHRVDHVVAQRPEILRALERRAAQPREALVRVLPALLDEPVGVGEQRRARLEVGACCRVRRALERAERGAAPADQVGALPGRGDDEQRRMAGRRVVERRRRGIDHREQHGRHVVPRHREVEVVQALQQPRRIAFEQRVGTHRAAQLTHRRRGGDPAPGDVPDHEQELAARQRDRVVPVAADLGARAAREVARRGLQAGQHRQGLRQQRALQVACDEVLALEQAHALDGERRALGGQREDRRVVEAEAPREQRADVQRADRAAVDQQRDAEQRGDRVAERVARGLAVARHRAARRKHLRREAALRQPPGARRHRPGHALGHLVHRRGPVVLVQQDRGAVDAEHVGHAHEQLADQLVERQRSECRIRDPLHGREPLRELLGLGALGLRAHERDALGLGALAVAQVVDLHDQPRVAGATVRDRREAAHARNPLVGHVEQHELRRIAAERAGQQGLAPFGVLAAHLVRDEPVERARLEVRGGAAQDRAKRPVRVQDRAPPVEPRHADRRVLEDRAPQRLALGQRARRLVQRQEDADLGPQHLGVVGLEQVVHRAGGVALVDVRRLGRDRRHEDDRDLPRAVARLDQPRGLEPVEPRHLHVEQDHRVVVLQQRLERLLARRRRRHAAVQRREHRLHRNEVVVAIVDEQDLGLHPRFTHTRISAVSWSMSTGLVM